jgi:para-aminobenzoate synthetase/4-amino-4-deoxychorismate lyase
LRSTSIWYAASWRTIRLRLPAPPHRIRLLRAQNGAVSVEAVPFDPPATDAVVRVALAPAPVDDRDPFLYHKTTRRRFYERALEARPGFDDVLLFNKNGDVTESTRSNVVIQIDGARYTPPGVALLPGSFRRCLVESGE